MSRDWWPIVRHWWPVLAILALEATAIGVMWAYVNP